MSVACARCGTPVEPPRTTYCSERCGRAARRQRQRVADRLRGKPRTHASFAFTDFVRASRKRLVVPEGPKAQAQARLLVGQGGMTAYENAQGLIRDLGMPRDSADAGLVFSRRERLEASALAKVEARQ